MKTLRLSLIAAFSLFATATFALAPIEETAATRAAYNELKTYVVEKIDRTNLSIDEAKKVRISFRVTADNEIVVLKTKNASHALERMIKLRLNNEELDIKNLPADQTYHIDVKFDVI